MNSKRNRTRFHGRTAGIVLALSIVCCVLFVAACVALPGARPAASQDLEVGIEVGQLAPDFELTDLRGQQVKLSNYRGQVVLINFWATWCGYCRTEFPVIQESYERNREKGLVVLAVNVQDRRQNVQAYVEEMGLTFPILLDPLGRATGSYQARGLPTSYFVNQEGVIVLKQVGPVDRAMIDGVLEQAGAS